MYPVTKYAVPTVLAPAANKFVPVPGALADVPNEVATPLTNPVYVFPLLVTAMCCHVLNNAVPKDAFTKYVVVLFAENAAYHKEL
jgi:hypothetical protein